MAHLVKTTHQLYPFDPAQNGMFDMMALFDSASGQQVVSATRAGGSWTIHAEGLEDATAADRRSAITALNEHALELHPGTFVTVMTPPGVEALP